MKENEKSTSTFGIPAVALGALALLAAVTHFFAGPIAPEPAIEEVIVEAAARIRDAAVAKVTGREYEAQATPASRDADDWLQLGTATAGALAIILAVIAFVRREDNRLSGSAVALGGAAIAFQFVVIALGVIVLLVLIGYALEAFSIF